jgi:hypothetical protein
MDKNKALRKIVKSKGANPIAALRYDLATQDRHGKESTMPKKSSMDQQTTPITTADSAKSGRLVVDAGKKTKKRKILKKAIKDGKGGLGDMFSQTAQQPSQDPSSMILRPPKAPQTVAPSPVTITPPLPKAIKGRATAKRLANSFKMRKTPAATFSRILKANVKGKMPKII